jgi:hypothetical protein
MTKATYAALDIDWQQVVLNGGPPCFHVEDGRFCLRAERWEGHDLLHRFVSLRSLLAADPEESDLAAARDAIVDAALKCHEANGCTGVGNIDRAVVAYRKLRDGGKG